MLFSTPFFLFVFLPVFMLLYWLLPARRAVLLLGSLIFYGWSEPVFVWVVIGSAFLDWRLGVKIVRAGDEAKRSLWLGVAVNLGLLLYVKYTAFAVENLNGVLKFAGVAAFPVPRIALPLGISFIVFEKITYLVDIHRRKAAPASSFLDYLNYVFLFAKLLAGPIIKYNDIAGQLASQSHRYEDIRDGVIRFLYGLGKKVLIADSLGPVADSVFALPHGSLQPSTAWLGVACFTLQIFFDFSGYSDMAIGLARMLGYRLMENFRDPYLATSFTDFWRRWHISLSTWIKEYLYIPLGGSRKSEARTYVNLVICFLLSGLWHGAAWNFVIWGCFHGIMLVADRAFWLRVSARIPWLVNVGITLFLVAISWVFFRSPDLSSAVKFLQAMFGQAGAQQNAVCLTYDTRFFLIVGALLALKPLMKFKLWEKLIAPRPALALAWGIVLLVLCTGRLAVSSFNPFLYFRF